MLEVSKNQTQTDLKPYIARLSGCVDGAIRAFQAQQATALYLMRSVTQANLLRDYIVDRVKAEFPDGEGGITHHERRGLFLLNIKNAYYLRVKKFGRRHQTSNSPTQLCLDFLWQAPLVLFPELPAAAHLNLGYKPGVTLVESTVWITCPNGNDVDWTWQLSEKTEPIQLPILPDVNRARPTKRLARLKVMTALSEQGNEASR